MAAIAAETRKLKRSRVLERINERGEERLATERDDSPDFYEHLARHFIEQGRGGEGRIEGHRSLCIDWREAIALVSDGAARIW